MMTKYCNYFIIFMVNTVSIILELVASRILSPFFGSTNDVWTVVIGMILLSSSVGNVLGGRLKRGRYVKTLLLLSLAASIMLVPFFATAVMTFAKDLTGSLRMGAMASAVLLFFIPSMLCGMFTPVLLSENTENMEELGRSSGLYYAVITLGGLAGTFAGGFWLIPTFGSMRIICILAVVCALLPLLAREKTWTVSLAVAAVLGLCSFPALQSRSFANVIYEADSQYNHIMVFEDEVNGNKVRFLNLGSQNSFMTATYTDERRFLPYSAYLARYEDAIPKRKTEEDRLRFLMLGGGGYGYPKWFLSRQEHEADHIDVVELDQGVIDTARKYFYLDEALELFDPGNERFTNYTGDGRIFLEEQAEGYNVIMNDTFAGGGVPARTLTTVEFMRAAYAALREDGVFVINVIGSLEGRHSAFLQAEYKTLSQVFPETGILRVRDVDNETRTNYLLVGAKTELPEGAERMPVREDAILLTDDYSPVDSLFH